MIVGSCINTMRRFIMSCLQICATTFPIHFKTCSRWLLLCPILKKLLKTASQTRWTYLMHWTKSIFNTVSIRMVQCIKRRGQYIKWKTVKFLNIVNKKFLEWKYCYSIAMIYYMEKRDKHIKKLSTNIRAYANGGCSNTWK